MKGIACNLSAKARPPARRVSTTPQLRRGVLCFVMLCVALLLVPRLFAPASAQAGQNVIALEPGQAIEQELAGGGAHAYQLTLAAGQYLKVVVEQRGIDVAVTLFGPDGKLIFEFDREPRRQGQETLAQVAEVSGRYRLTVQAKQQGVVAGRYEIRVVELRAATEQDRALQEARRLLVEAERLWRAAKYDEALPVATRSMEIRARELGPEHPDLAQSLNRLGAIHADKGDYAQAEPLYQRALQIREKVLGPEHPNIATSLTNLGAIYADTGDYAQAEPMYQRALQIWEQALGPEHPDVANSLTSLAILYTDKGDYARAEAFYQRALVIREKALGAEHPYVATSLNNLAGLLRAKGEYARAEPLYQRALQIRERVLGPEHPTIARTLNDFAALYWSKGDYARAEPLYQRALQIWERALGPDHLEVAYALNSLAILYWSKGDYARAEPLYLRALAIREKRLGAEHSEVANTLNGLATLYRDQGDFAQAEPLYKRALEIWEKALGATHPDVARALNNLAKLYTGKGDYARAQPLYERALQLREQALGPTHPDVANSLADLARFYEVKGELARAVAFQLRANRISERNLALNLASGSERQKLAYLATLSTQLDQTISLHARTVPNDPAARNEAASIILQRKGRTLDALTDSFATLRRRFNLQDQALLDELKETNAQLAKLVLGGPQRMSRAEHQKQITALEEQKEKLEAEISSRSAEFRAQSQPVTLAAIQSAIPAEAALIEFAVYRPFNAHYAKPAEAFGPPRYVAYVLRRQGEVKWVELGEQQTIDEAIANLRQALRDPRRTDVKRLARKVDEQVMRPLRALLGATRRVLLSPDGALNLLPFAALVDEQQRYLVTRYSFSYLTSGRDLLRLQLARASQSAPLIIADPAFGERAAAPMQRDLGLPSAGEQSDDLQSLLARARFQPLPGTAAEAQALKRILPQATVLTREQATKAALKQASSPRLLHLATHGFFLQDPTAGVAGTRDLGLFGAEAAKLPAATRGENPLLRSGLALAGANQRGNEDGVLTALEVAGLDLWGTQLVTLSACNTGVGEVKNGEGVYGLRRALVLAGSESQVMSLWPVSDQGTRELMIAYYRGLQRGAGRSAALRQVQLRMLQHQARRHPYYWASFIQSGAWQGLKETNSQEQ